MEYFKINYDRLQNLHQIKYYKIIIIVLCLLSILVILGCFINISKKISFYGVYKDNVLKIQINSELSDILKNQKHIEFNDTKTAYKILRYGEYEIVDNKIYQEVDLAIEKNFSNNEVGLVELYYDKQTIIKYVFELFK